ncbi:hypothetical protein [Allocoleopsis franciscana]|uniref:Uncharacterized protein n=1 Tax=Allocoleopsis franciscana PCC 7113 TaxID=1173027 RepID=K9WP61_9CYAN|nr:hypothetical protein [Allocoleopsis franciscana]AFZ22180.1 hypothetical protein Mic7113_6608 [Allocoleopsis franciscana PCC 7113]
MLPLWTGYGSSDTFQVKFTQALPRKGMETFSYLTLGMGHFWVYTSTSPQGDGNLLVVGVIVMQLFFPKPLPRKGTETFHKLRRIYSDSVEQGTVRPNPQPPH